MPTPGTDLRIFAGSASTQFSEKMCRYLGVEPGKGQSFRFSEGNSYVKIGESVRREDVFIVQTIGLDANDSFMELLFWIDAFKRSSASSVTVIMPFFSYAKADKKDEPRVSIRARVCADCLEAVGVDRVITMDLHSPQIQGFFKVPVDHLLAEPILCAYIQSKKIPDLCVVSPDAGFAKNARRYAAALGLPTVVADKTRTDHTEHAQVLELIGDVRGKNCVIFDDFTNTCGTLVEVARALRQHGAGRIFAAVSHSLLQDRGLRALEQSDIEELVVTDTVHSPEALGHPKVRTLSVAPLFAEAARIIHAEDSLSVLFREPPAALFDAAVSYCAK